MHYTISNLHNNVTMLYVYCLGYCFGGQGIQEYGGGGGCHITVIIDNEEKCLENLCSRITPGFKETRVNFTKG